MQVCWLCERSTLGVAKQSWSQLRGRHTGEVNQSILVAPIISLKVCYACIGLMEISEARYVHAFKATGLILCHLRNFQVLEFHPGFPQQKRGLICGTVVDKRGAGSGRD
jgi:hypothetical protein